MQENDLINQEERNTQARSYHVLHGANPDEALIAPVGAPRVLDTVCTSRLSSNHLFNK